MAYWLVKSEPDTWSWDQHVAAGTDVWSGVRNHQAKINMNKMKRREGVLYYHSGDAREIVGVTEVVREAYPDPTDETGKFVTVELRARGPLKRPVPLAEIKADPALADMVLATNSRLSVQPVTEAEWDRIIELGGA